MGKGAGSKGAWRDGLALASLLGLHGTLLARNAFRRFEFFDMSGFMDAGYRVLRGQSLYADFSYSAGPLHPLLHALFFRLFGFNKTAVLWHLLSVALLASALFYGVCRRHLGAAASFALGLVFLHAFYGPVSHPWYDQNAALFVILGAFLFERLAPEDREAPSWVPAAAGACVGLAFLTKANVAASGAVVMLAYLAVRPGPRRSAALLGAGFLAVVAAALAALRSPGDYLAQNFGTFDVAAKVFNPGRLAAVVAENNHIPLALGLAGVCSLGGGAFTRAQRGLAAAGAAFLAASVFNGLTGSMIPAANQTLIAFPLLYISALAARLPRGGAAGRLRSAALAGAACLGLAALRHARLHALALTAFTWRPMLLDDSYKMTNEPLRGWGANPLTGSGLDRTVEFINSRIPPGDSIYVFPDATVIYGIVGRPSYLDAGFMQQEGFPKGEYLERFRRRFHDQPPAWIIWHEHRSYVYPPADIRAVVGYFGFFDAIKADYARVWSYGEFAVLRRRK